MQYRIPQQVYPEDPRLNQSGDDRPNTGLREGNIPHAEVNDTIRGSEKTVIFGQQTRLRNGELLPDQKLPRFHAGHDLVKFFYSALRQLPPYLLDALLEETLGALDAAIASWEAGLSLRAPIHQGTGLPITGEADPVEIAPDLREGLRQLGYVE